MSDIVDAEITNLDYEQHARAEALDRARKVLTSHGPMSSSLTVTPGGLVYVAEWIVRGNHEPDSDEPEGEQP